MTLVRRLLWLVTALYWVVLFALTHTRPVHIIRGPSNDKLQHFLAYFVLGCLLGVTLWVARPARRKMVPLLVVAIGAAYGVFDELTQIPVGRDAEVLDWLADLSGSAAAAAIVAVVNFVHGRRSPRQPLASEQPVAA